jgi:hypothetical protein
VPKIWLKQPDARGRVVVECRVFSAGFSQVQRLKRADTSPLIIQLLVYLGISTLAAASDLTFKIVLYILLELAVVLRLYTMVDAQKLDESVLIRLTHYHRKPLPKRKLL